MSYRGHIEKKPDEHNTVRRYHADSNKISKQASQTHEIFESIEYLSCVERYRSFIVFQWTPLGLEQRG